MQLPAPSPTTVPRRWRRKWAPLLAFWGVQAMAMYVLGAVLVASAQNVHPGNLGRFTWDDYKDVLADRDWFWWWLVIGSIITAAQGILLLPVRKPGARSERGWPLWMSLGVAGLAIAVLSGALATSVAQVSYTFDSPLAKAAGTRFHDWGLRDEVLTGLWCLVSWSIATPLLVRFSRNKRKEDYLSRLASRLFLGTMVEVAAIIPLDVMVRKRESCYCFAGTYFALIGCGIVAVFAFGPAVLIPIVAKRRRRWYAGHCDACGYDMSGSMTAPRCPECGAGWRG